jgi:D-glucuronyl C5-epimerase C-terminus
VESVTPRHVTLAAVLAAALIAAPSAVAGGPPIEIEPPGSPPVERPLLSLTAGRAPTAARTVEAALVEAGVGAAERRAYLRTLGRAQRLAGRMGGPAGAELAAVVATAVQIARRTGFTPERARAVFFELGVNVRELPKGLPAANARLRIDSLTFQRYPGKGLRVQPLASWWFARDTARHGDVKVTRRLLDAALELSVQRGNALTTEYLFAWGRGAPPWSSPMAHGLAADALARGFALTGDERYRDAALQFARSIAASDVAEGDDVWFPLYPFEPGLRVLNADLQVIIGLERVRQLEGAEAYGTLADAARATAVARLGRYDTGAWSRYSEQREAPLEYHDLHTEQLGLLGRLTDGGVFADYGTAFGEYRIQPPLLDLVPGGVRRIYPVPAEGFRDSARVSFTLSKPARVRGVFRRPGGGGKTIDFGLRSSGTHVVRWAPGRIAPGSYTLILKGTDLAGNGGRIDGEGAVEVARDTTPPRIVAVTVRGGRLRWKLEDAGTPWVNVVIGKGRSARTLKRRKLTGSAPVGGTPSLVRFVDSSGNVVRWRRVPVAAPVPQ